MAKTQGGNAEREQALGRAERAWGRRRGVGDAKRGAGAGTRKVEGEMRNIAAAPALYVRRRIRAVVGWR
eukprot:356457-Chlamydomonas_euryale.AAC.8